MSFWRIRPRRFDVSGSSTSSMLRRASLTTSRRDREHSLVVAFDSLDET